MFYLIAQATQPAASGPYPEFSTTAGIVSVVLVAVQILKYALADVPYARRVPTWAYSVAVAVGVTAFSVFILEAMDRAFGPAVWQAVKAAAVASGFHSWVRSVRDGDTPADKSRSRQGSSQGGGGGIGGGTVGAILALVVLVPLSGCTAPQTPTDAWYHKRAAVNDANQAFLAATPALDDEDRVFYGRILQSAREALTRAETELPEGGDRFSALLNIAEAALQKWAQWETDHESADDDRTGANRSDDTPLRPEGGEVRRERGPDHARAARKDRPSGIDHRRPGRSGSRGCRGTPAAGELIGSAGSGVGAVPPALSLRLCGVVAPG